LRHHFDLVIEPNNARDPLAAIDAKLPFMERANAAPNRHKPVIRSNLHRAEPGKMLPRKKAFHPTFKVSVGGRCNRISGHQYLPGDWNSYEREKLIGRRCRVPRNNATSVPLRQI
jgi:hypothetical protein